MRDELLAHPGPLCERLGIWYLAQGHLGPDFSILFRLIIWMFFMIKMISFLITLIYLTAFILSWALLTEYHKILKGLKLLSLTENHIKFGLVPLVICHSDWFNPKNLSKRWNRCETTGLVISARCNIFPAPTWMWVWMEWLNAESCVT